VTKFSTDAIYNVREYREKIKVTPWRGDAPLLKSVPGRFQPAEHGPQIRVPRRRHSGPHAIHRQTHPMPQEEAQARPHETEAVRLCRALLADGGGPLDPHEGRPKRLRYRR
jgi:hypothetical protein